MGVWQAQYDLKPLCDSNANPLFNIQTIQWPVCIKSSKYYLLENVRIYFNVYA